MASSTPHTAAVAAVAAVAATLEIWLRYDAFEYYCIQLNCVGGGGVYMYIALGGFVATFF